MIFIYYDHFNNDFKVPFSTKILSILENNTNGSLITESELICKTVLFCQLYYLMLCYANYFKELIFVPWRFYFLKLQCHCLFPKLIYIGNNDLRIIRKFKTKNSSITVDKWEAYWRTMVKYNLRQRSCGSKN